DLLQPAEKAPPTRSLLGGVAALIGFVVVRAGEVEIGRGRKVDRQDAGLLQERINSGVAACLAQMNDVAAERFHYGPALTQEIEPSAPVLHQHVAILTDRFAHPAESR